ncbi:MAG: GNAT family N-acetyltransferase [Planctomycetota bacterium]|jgi:GNAT superfamily N-acetyltransferase
MRPDGIRILATRGAERLDTVRRVRFEVLRQPLGLPFEATLFDGDALPTTQHLLAWDAGQPLGCLTLLIPDSSEVVSDSSPVKVQLRGMAVVQRAQGRGVGSCMLAEVHRLASSHGWSLWCNAREGAVPFYAKNGWLIRGEPFDIPKIGPHFVMCWEPRE